MRSKILIFVLSLMLVSALTFSADNFEKGGKYVTPQIGLNSWAIPIGASYGIGFTENIEIGGTVMAYFFDGISVIVPSADAMYHFTELDLPVDLFGGASLGYTIYSGGGDMFLTPFLGARYFFKDNLAVSFKAYFSILGTYKGVGGFLGVTLVL